MARVQGSRCHVSRTGASPLAQSYVLNSERLKSCLVCWARGKVGVTFTCEKVRVRVLWPILRDWVSAWRYRLFLRSCQRYECSHHLPIVGETRELPTLYLPLGLGRRDRHSAYSPPRGIQCKRARRCSRFGFVRFGGLRRGDLSRTWKGGQVLSLLARGDLLSFRNFPFLLWPSPWAVQLLAGSSRLRLSGFQSFVYEIFILGPCSETVLNPAVHPGLAWRCVCWVGRVYVRVEDDG